MKLFVNEMDVVLSNRKILKNIHFHVEAGAFVSILGASGCGKSTLLKTIAGIIECDTGQILIDNQDVSHLPAHKRNVVIAFQDARLFPHMNVAKNIDFPLKMRKLNPSERKTQIQELLAKVQLSGYENRMPDKLSGGELQRVALARALAAKPTLLLLDEPFSSLDENLRFDMQVLISRLQKEYGITTIMVTHDKKEALSMSDVIMVMNEGKIIQIGHPTEVYHHPANIAAAKYFGGATFVNGRIENGTFKSPEFIFDCPNKSDGNYTFMMRSEALHFSDGETFVFVQTIYDGTHTRAIYEHKISHLRITINIDESESTIRRFTSFHVNQKKLLFFKSEI